MVEVNSTEIVQRGSETSGGSSAQTSANIWLDHDNKHNDLNAWRPGISSHCKIAGWQDTWGYRTHPASNWRSWWILLPLHWRENLLYVMMYQDVTMCFMTTMCKAVCLWNSAIEMPCITLISVIPSSQVAYSWSANYSLKWMAFNCFSL